MKLTSHERIMRIFRNEEVDRPVLKVWGAHPDIHLLHPAYEPVHKLSMEKTDLFLDAGSPIDVQFGRNASQYIEMHDVPQNDTWVDCHRYYHLPGRTLHSVERRSLKGDPTYILEHAIKEPEDIEALMAVPYEPFSFEARHYENGVRKVGDRGIMMFSIPHAGYAAQMMMGSETIAFMSIDERELLKAYIDLLGGRIRDHVKAAINSGIRGVFGWVGPELLIPPLMSYNDFREFVYDVDKPICDDIHNAGGHVWMHCHGKVAKLLPDFISMGIDVLNPLEPPKNGDIILHEDVAKYGRAIGWEGNIEIQSLIQDDAETIREQIRYCADIAKQVNRFVLCPSAGYNEYPRPDENYINNMLLFMNYGLECLEN